MSGQGEPAAARPNRRTSERIGILGGLQGGVLLPQPVSVLELGIAGALIETTFPFQLESLHDLRLLLGRRSIVVKGRVSHCGIVDVDHEGVRYRSGVHFVGVADRTRAAIEEFVKGVKTGRRRVTAL